MVKKYLNFKTQRTGFLPAINSRRMGVREFRTAAYKSHGGSTEKTDDEKSDDEILADIAEQAKSFNAALGDKADKAVMDKLEKDLAEVKEALAAQDSARFTEAIKTINAANAKMHQQLIEMQEEAAKKAEGGNGAGTAKAPYNLDKVKAFSKGCVETKRADTAPLEIEGAATGFRLKAAETFGYPQTFVSGTDISAFTGRMIDPTLYAPKRKTNIILDHLQIRPISVPTLIYLNKVEIGDSNPVADDPGKADWIACGDAKPKRSFRVGSQEVNAKKVAIFGTIEDCLLQDVPSFEEWIREDYAQQMREAINAGLLNGNPAIDPLLPLGLKTNAVQYAATPAYNGTIQDPNYIDAIIAIAAFFAFNRERLDRVFVSSDVFYRILHLKDNDSRYLNNDKVYTNALGEVVIAGTRVIMADEDDVPSTNVLALGAELGFRIHAYGPMVIEKGLNDTDFREDKTSFRGYQRFLSYIPEDRENSVMYDTWANIFAAINKAATT